MMRRTLLLGSSLALLLLGAAPAHAATPSFTVAGVSAPSDGGTVTVSGTLTCGSPFDQMQITINVLELDSLAEGFRTVTVDCTGSSQPWSYQVTDAIPLTQYMVGHTVHLDVVATEIGDVVFAQDECGDTTITGSF